MFFQKDPKQQDGEPPRPEDQPEDIIISPDTHRDNRIPQNQSRTKKWPVLDTGVHPSASELTPAVWHFELTGLVESPLTLTWEEFQKLPRARVFGEINCKVNGEVSVQISI